MTQTMTKTSKKWMTGMMATALLTPSVLATPAASADEWGAQPPHALEHWQPAPWDNQVGWVEDWSWQAEEAPALEDTSSWTATTTAGVTSSVVTADAGNLVSTSAEALANAQLNASSANMYPIGQCTWGVKELAPWAYTYWGNATDWAANAAADGFAVGTTPVVGAIAVWTSTDGGYGHVAYVTDVASETSIQVLEANIAGNPAIANYRGYFNPTTTAEGTVSYIYPPAQS